MFSCLIALIKGPTPHRICTRRTLYMCFPALALAPLTFKCQAVLCGGCAGCLGSRSNNALSLFVAQVLHETFPQHTFLMNGLIHGVKVRETRMHAHTVSETRTHTHTHIYIFSYTCKHLSVGNCSHQLLQSPHRMRCRVFLHCSSCMMGDEF